jgi:hypothetical protein
MIVYLMCGWYQKDDGMADFYEVEATIDKAKQACLTHAIGWCDLVDDLTLVWEEVSTGHLQAVIDEDDTLDGEYIYEIMQRDLTE